MNKKIYGIPVATPLNPNRIVPNGVVKTVNGIAPNENGNLELDWVARKIPQPIAILDEASLKNGITNVLDYDDFAGQDELAITYDGCLFVCVPHFVSNTGDGDSVWIGNQSLMSSSMGDTGEPFYFLIYKGSNSMVRFEDTNNHTVSVTGSAYTYDQMPEGYLPNGVVKSVNGTTPDENGNVEVSVAGGSAELSDIVRYYSDLSTAITDINNGVATNALADSDNAKVSVFTAHTGVLTVMLLNDVSESVAITVNKDIDLVLNGKALNLITAAAVLTFGVGTKCRINGEVVGSSVVMDGVSATANTAMITTNGDLLEIHGGEYKIHMNNTKRVSCIVAGASCGKLLMSAANMHVYNDGVGQCRILQSQAKKSLIENVHGIGVSGSIIYGIFLGGDMEVRNSEINVRGGTEGAYGVSTYDGFDFKINDSRLLAVSNVKKAIAIWTKPEARTYAENTYMFTDSPDCHADSGNHALAVLSQGETHLTNCVCVGTHSAAMTTEGTLYINGGEFTGFCHGGVYVSTSECDVFINDAIVRCGNYEGEFDYSGKTAEIYGSMYICGSANSNNITAYLDGCTIEHNGEHPIVMRGTDGEQNNTINISNSNIGGGTIRIDNDTLKLNVGIGTNITTDMIENPARAEFTGELYRRNYEDKVLNGKDYNALLALAADVPTDDHINDLINTALGVIENGTY